VIAKLKTWGADTVEELSGVEEKIVFALPKTLRDKDRIKK